MARIKGGLTKHQKKNKLLGKTKGFRGGRSKLKKQAKEAVLHSGKYSFAGRKNKKRNFRKIWIQRITAASKNEGVSYNKLISGLKAVKIDLDRKILADIAQNDPKAFKEIVSSIK